jgi:hypothetical protein
VISPLPFQENLPLSKKSTKICKKSQTLRKIA